MRICSFLPSATEILFALGVGECVAGVTFECDYPPEARSRAVVVHTVLQGGLTPEQIDEAVRRQAAAGGSLYFVDLAQLQAIEPDVIVTQDLCHVCALSAPDLAIALRELRSKPLVISLSPHTLEQVFADIETVAAAVGRSEQGSALVDELRQRVTRVRQRAGTTPGPRVLCLECWRRSTRAATGSRR